MTESVASMVQNLVMSTRVHYFWSGAGSTNAPSAAFTGAIGANNDGATTANVYHYTGSSWVDTGATVANLYGG